MITKITIEDGPFSWHVGIWYTDPVAVDHHTCHSTLEEALAFVQSEVDRLGKGKDCPPWKA